MLFIVLNENYLNYMKYAGKNEWNESSVMVTSGERIIDDLHFSLSFFFFVVVIFHIFHSAHIFPTRNYFKSFSSLVNSACTIVQSPNTLSLLPETSPASPSSMLLLDEFFEV